MKKIYQLIVLCLINFSSLHAQNLITHFSLGSTDSDGLMDFTTDIVKNQYVAGFYSGSVDLDPGSGTTMTSGFGDRDIFVGKLDSAGNFIWGFGIGSAQDDEASHICLDHSGNVIVAGRFSGSIDFNPGIGVNLLVSAGGRDMFIVKYDSAGNYLWGFSGGGSIYDDTEDVTVDLNDNIYVAGSFTNSATFNGIASLITITGNGQDDPYIIKYNSSGSLLWAVTMGSTGVDDISSILTDDHGHLYVAGYFSGQTDFDFKSGTYILNPIGSADAFVARYSNDADLDWVTYTGGTGFDLVMDFEVVNDRIYATGGYHDAVDFNPGVGSNVKVSAGGYDLFIWQLDTLGSYINAISSGGTGDDFGRCLVSDKQNGYLLSGLFSGNFILNGISDSLTLNSHGGFDIVLAGYSDLLELNWGFCIGGAADEDSRSVHANGDGKFSVYGAYEGNIDLSPDILNPIVVFGNGDQEAFFAKYDIPPVPVGLSSMEHENINFYPNPANDLVTIKSESILHLVEVFSLSGNKLSQYFPFANEYKLSLNNLTNGNYIIRIISESGSTFRKLVKL